MTRVLRSFPCHAALILMLFTCNSQAWQTSDAGHEYPIRPVPFKQVHVSDAFWAPRMEINRTVSIPTAFDQCERTGRIENFVRAAQVLRGQDLKDRHAPPFPFDDTDPYKVIEGASYSLNGAPGSQAGVVR